MKKDLCIVLLLALLVSLIISGCTIDSVFESKPIENNEGKMNANLPIVSDDYFSLLCTNTNVEISKNSYFRSVQYGFISAFKVKTENMKLYFDKDIPFTYSVEMQDDVIPIDIVAFSTYQGISWIDLAKSSEITVDTARQKLQQYGQVLTSISEDAQPKLYSGILTIRFNDAALVNDVTLTQLTVIVNGTSYNYEIGALRLLPSSFYVSYGEGLLMDTLALTDVNVSPSHDGIFYAEGIKMSAQDNVTITKVYFNTDLIKLNEVSFVNCMSDGMVLDSVWDQDTPIYVNKGTTISFNISASDEKLRDTLIGNRQLYLIFEYTVSDAHYTVYCELTYRMRQHPFHVYAFVEERQEIIGYYTEYLPTINAQKNLRDCED